MGVGLWDDTDDPLRPQVHSRIAGRRGAGRRRSGSVPTWRTGLWNIGPRARYQWRARNISSNRRTQGWLPGRVRNGANLLYIKGGCGWSGLCIRPGFAQGVSLHPRSLSDHVSWPSLDPPTDRWLWHCQRHFFRPTCTVLITGPCRLRE